MMKSECSDTRETQQPQRLTQTSMSCTWEKLTTQQACLPHDQGSGSEEGFVEQAGGRELSCQSRQSINSVSSVVEFTQHDPQCRWSFTSQYTPVIVRWGRGKVRIGHRIPHVSCTVCNSIKRDKDRTISFMIFIVSDEQRCNFINAHIE